MSDFGWDLQAVVRGCNNIMSNMEEDVDPHTCFSPLMMNYQYYQFQEEEDDLIFGNVVFPDQYLFADSSNNNLDLDLLEDLYKPFYPHDDSFSLSPQLSTNYNNNSLEEKVLSINNSPADQILINHVAGRTDHDSKYSKAAPAVGAINSKYRRRKNIQHKRVVMEVTAEGLSSDMWAWRKYGQKPIKGSPYPRSYYRCSSSRGCPARKQVERSHSDIPTTITAPNFIITYTAEHNHSKPTRRNSLAGTTRQRFSNSNTTTSTAAAAENNTSEDMMMKKKIMILKKKMKKKKNKTEEEEEEEVKLMINEEEEDQVIISSTNYYDHPAAAAVMTSMMIMNDDFLGADFEDAQLNNSPSSSSSLLQYHHTTTTTTNFW